MDGARLLIPKAKLFFNPTIQGPFLSFKQALRVFSIECIGGSTSVEVYL